MTLRQTHTAAISDRLCGWRCARFCLRDRLLDPTARHRRHLLGHLGLRGAAERDPRCQPALALVGDPRYRHLNGQDLLSEGVGRGLRQGQGLRILLRRTTASPARRRQLAYQHPGDQITSSDHPMGGRAPSGPDRGRPAAAAGALEPCSGLRRARHCPTPGFHPNSRGCSRSRCGNDHQGPRP